MPSRPRLGACYRLSAGGLTRPASSVAPVGCVRDHTALTIFVGQLSTVVDGHAVGVDSTTVERQLSSTCPAKLAAYVGGDRQQRALSRFSVVWFRPTPAQSDRGASWFRCDLVAFGRQGSLYPLPDGGDLSRVLDRTGALGTYGLCGTAAPGANGFRRVICARPHSWRAFSTVVLSGPDYPGVDTLRQAGDGACRSRARAGLAGSLRFRYGWEWPTREQWRAGQHYGYCWAPS